MEFGDQSAKLSGRDDHAPLFSVAVPQADRLHSLPAKPRAMFRLPSPRSQASKMTGKLTIVRCQACVCCCRFGFPVGHLGGR